MQAGRRYSFFQTVNWTRKYIFLFIVYDALLVGAYQVFTIGWFNLPWQPISLIGIAVAFYLGFKNNSSYERLWEARKIWGGIVNTSRAFAVMARDFVNNETTQERRSDEELKQITKGLIFRHIAWLHALVIELRRLKEWEHNAKADQTFREYFGTNFREERFEKLRKYLSEEDYQYILSKGNRSSHILSQQSKRIMDLRHEGIIEHFRHLEMQNQITELFALQGKSERIKNFPFPRQYATVNYIFVILFILLLPFGMINVFSGLEDYWVWFAIPFSVIGSWVFWMMELIGDFSENPFEGLYNDVPISQMATGIEIDILQMIEETDLPDPIQPQGSFNIVT